MCALHVDKTAEVVKALLHESHRRAGMVTPSRQSLDKQYWMQVADLDGDSLDAVV